MERSEVAACKVLVPTGMLGAGWPDEALDRGVSLRPDCIACDAGSTDSGPYYLGAATTKASRGAVKHDLRRLMLARDKLRVPLLIGSCGTSGTDAGVDWTAEIAREIAREEGLSARMALVYSEQSAEALSEWLDGGRITPLTPSGPLSQEALDGCDHIVGLLGDRPLIAALQEGADIVLSGRTTDTAVIAAAPLMRGLPPGPTWHAAKTAECGGLCTVNQRQGGVLITIDTDGFDIEPLHASNRCTPATVLSHMLYENADPFRLTEPGVLLDAERANYAALDERRVRVTGSTAELKPYSMKLEGAGGIGYRTMAFTALSDPKIMARIGEWLERLEAHLRAGIGRVLRVGEADYTLELRPYGWNALHPRPRTPTPTPPLEVGVMLLVGAATQEAATEIAKYCNPFLLHYPLDPAEPMPSFAFPYSPIEAPLGKHYEFKLNHVVWLDDPLQLSRMTLETIGSEPSHG